MRHIAGETGDAVRGRTAAYAAGTVSAAVQGWFVLIGVSVLTRWQHHVIDIPAGLAAAALAAGLVRMVAAPPTQHPAASRRLSAPSARLQSS